MKAKSALFLIYVAVLFGSGQVLAATYYVDGTYGINGNDGRSLNTAKQTIAAGLELLDAGSPGDVLLIADGRYIERLEIGVSGNSMAYKEIKAINPGLVIVDGESAAYQSTVNITGDYVKVEGLKFIHGGSYCGVISSSSDHAYFKNCAFIGADATSAYAEVFHNNGSYALVEDCWMAGGGRYLINDGGGRYNVYRRVVGRWDYSLGNQPIGGFMNYHQQSIAGGHDTVYQNVIAIDFNDPIGHDTWLTGGFADKYGHNISRVGCIAMNIKSSDETGSGASPDKVGQRMVGFFDEPSSGDGRTGSNTYEDCVSIENYFGFRQVRPGTTTVTNLTAINSQDAAVGYNRSTVPFTNSLFVNNTNPVHATGSYSHSHFEGEPEVGSSATSGPAGLLYPLRLEIGSAVYGTGSTGANKGAFIVKRIGTDGTHYGDVGWNQLTDDDLWPYPNEERIRNDFRSVVEPPSGVVPSSTDPTRGFCADGQTLTEYIWESLGNSIGDPKTFDYSAGAPPTTITCYLDADGDHYSDGTFVKVESCQADYFTANQLTATSGDCDDSNPAINPGATDIPDNQIDEDCSGADSSASLQPPHIYLEKNS